MATFQACLRPLGVMTFTFIYSFYKFKLTKFISEDFITMVLGDESKAVPCLKHTGRFAKARE